MKLLKKIPLLISLLVLFAAFYVKRQEYPVIEQLSFQLFDAFQRYKPREYTPLPVRIIDIDEESLQKIGQWPWPRVMLASLIDRLHAMGAASVSLDIVFSEQDRTSPAQITSLWDKELTEQQKALLGKLPDHDKLFGDAIHQANITTGFAFVQHPTQTTPHRTASISVAGSDPKTHLPHFMGSVTNIPAIEAYGTGSGALNIIPDYDGVVRRMPLFYVMNDRIYPAFSAETLRIAQGASGYIIKASGASGEENFGTDSGISAVKIGQFKVPTDASGAFWLHYTGSRNERYIPAWKLFEADFLPENIEGNIILIGSTASILKDFVATPYHFTASGVELHAQAIEQMMLGSYLNRPDWIKGMEAVIMLGIGLVFLPIMLRLPAIWGVLFAFSVFSGTFGYAWYAFDKEQLLVDAVYPSLAILLLYLSGSLSRYFISERKRKAIRNAFSHYMSPQMVDQLTKHPETLKLGGEMKELTLLFCDIRGFTSIAENFDAEGLTTFINRFLTPMTTIIMHKNGTIDKYMGDCIMAFWNAPLDDAQHAKHAALSSLEMLYQLDSLNNELQQEAHKKGVANFKIDVGIGLNTGVCCVGNMGSDQRFDYSVIGDDVNLASRLEGQSKTYGIPIILGEQTAKYIRDLALLEIDFIQVKGKTQAMRIFTLLGDENLARNEDFINFKEAFHAMLTCYRNQEWKEARKYLKQAKKLADIEIQGKISLSPHTLLAVFEARMTAYQKDPPPPDWEGIFIATTK